MNQNKIQIDLSINSKKIDPVTGPKYTLTIYEDYKKDYYNLVIIKFKLGSVSIPIHQVELIPRTGLIEIINQSVIVAIKDYKKYESNF